VVAGDGAGSLWLWGGGGSAIEIDPARRSPGLL
jgi:hypothetical protein